MKRHFQRLSLDVIIKRGFSIISALILSVGLVLTPVHAEDVNASQPALKISWIYFRSNTQTNNTGGNTTDQAWLIYNFEFDKAYTGTMRSILSYTCGFGYVPYMMVDGVYYTVQTEVTNQGSTSTTRQNTFDFVLTNTKSFKIIITVANTYLNYGGITTPSMDLVASDGSGSVSGVDYTNLITDVLGEVEDINLDLDTVISSLTNVETDVSSMLDILSSISTVLTSIGDNVEDCEEILNAVHNFITIPWYSRSMYMLLTRMGFTYNTTDALGRAHGWCLAKPSTLYNGWILYLNKDTEYSFILVSKYATNSKITLQRKDTSTTRELNLIRVNYSVDTYYNIKHCKFTVDTTGWYRINDITYVGTTVPVYFGETESMPEEVRVLIGYASTPTLLERIISLFQQNNAQNDEMIDKLDDINHDTDTISQQIDNLNNDFNNALSDVPINETLQEINNLNSAFQTVNGWWSQLWSALGVIKIVIILAMILMLIKIFLGRSR